MIVTSVVYARVEFYNHWPTKDIFEEVRWLHILFLAFLGFKIRRVECVSAKCKAMLMENKALSYVNGRHVNGRNK